MVRGFDSDTDSDSGCGNPARKRSHGVFVILWTTWNPEEHERQGIPGLLDEEQDLEFVRNLVGSRQCHRIDNAAANLSDSGA